MPVEIINAKGQYVFTAEDLQAPRGKNSLAAFAAMFQRTLYKDEMYPSQPGVVPRPLDTWYESTLFGRTDRKQNTIIPNTTNLAQITEAAEPIFAFNFVADAFSSFVEHMAAAYIAGAVSKAGIKSLAAPTAVGGYIDPTQKFNQMHQTLARSFILNFKSSREKPIENFKIFLGYYSQFLKNLASSFPVTKTNFVLSYRMNPFCTGLSVSLYDGDAGDDLTKYEKFILDPNFQFYTNVAKKFGFVVNKNKPWVLTADLFKSPILDRIDDYVVTETDENITATNFFSVYYNQTHLSDLADLKKILLSAYQYLVSGAPLCQKEKICPNGNFSYKSYLREVYDETKLRAQIGPKFLIDLYIDLRQAESAFALTPDQIKRLRKNAYESYKLRKPNLHGTPLQRAATTINSEYRKYIYPASLPRLTGIPLSMM